VTRHPEVVPVLITGVGDTVGQALLKAARMSSVPCRVVGTDRSRPCVGLVWADAGYVLPDCADEEAYLGRMAEICRAEQVRLVLPGSERELEVLARHADRLAAETGASVVASPEAVLDVALDKWRTCRFLERAGLAFPAYARPDTGSEVEELVAAVGFPLVAKPIHGTGSRGMYRLDSWQDIELIRRLGRPMVIQERLEPDEQEYSVSVFTPPHGEPPGAVTYRRDHLVAGDTYRARIDSYPVVEAEAIRVAAALRPSGPCNVQLRLTERGPVTFEINPRFSGGVGMRAHFGYNEVEMAVRAFALHQAVPRPRLTTGTAIRYWGEMYFDDPEVSPAGSPSNLSPGGAPGVV
jgi:carbamoyl-phosphate synthase large subunit